MKYLHLSLTATAVYAFFLVKGLQNNHYLDWTLFYPVFWIETPLIGWLMQRRRAGV